MGIFVEAAAAKVLNVNWHRCKVIFLRNALANAGKGQRKIVLAAINTKFAQGTFETAVAHWRIVADELRGKLPKFGALMDEAETDVLSYLAFPNAHRTQILSANPLERLNAEVKRRPDVVGISPGDAEVVWVVGAILLEQNDERASQRCDTKLEGLQSLIDNPAARLSAGINRRR